MKKLILVAFSAIAFLIITAYTFNNDGNKKSEQELIAQQLTGLWADSNSTDFSNGRIIFSVEGTNVEMMHYLEYKGKPMVEKGKGQIYGRRLDYFVVVTKSIPGWALTGEHFLTLSGDGKTLRGAYEDEKGNLGKLVFKKIGK